MVRAAAKNHPSVAIVTSPGALRRRARGAVAAGGFTLEQRQRLAAEAFVHTATYDVHVASWMGNVLTDTSDGTGFPAWTGAHLGQVRRCCATARTRTSRAALYANGFGAAGSPQAEQLHGKEMSYNNYVDADAARRAAYDFDEPAVAIIKHANPCGIAVGADVAEAHRKAHACDPVSAFGGVIAVNRPVSVEMAAQVAEVFTEVIVAPGYEDGAVEVLAGQEEHPDPASCAPLAPRRRRDPADLRRAAHAAARPRRRRRATTRRPGPSPPARPPRPSVLADLAFAWKACRSVKSNAILLASDGASVGVGMGQVNRVDSCRLAVAAGGGAGGRLGGGVRRVLPVRGRAADPASTPGSRDRAARRVGARRADRRGRPGRRA